jgi:hypothetical protein
VRDLSPDDPVAARYQLTAEDITSGRRFEDVVALRACAMEYHDAAGAPSTWISVKDKETYDIPLRTLTSTDTRSLYAAARPPGAARTAKAGRPAARRLRTPL